MYINSYGRLCSDDYLQHHGILGQKYGVRLGPPYPLDASKHSAAERKAGWRDSLKGNESRAERKAIKYRFKETQKSNKKHDKLIGELEKKIDKKTAKLEKLEAKGKNTKKIQKQIDEYAHLRARRRAMKAIESDAIKNMSIADIKSEKRKIGFRKATFAIRAVSGLVINGNAIGVDNVYDNYARRNTKGYKTASRIERFAKNGGNVQKYARKEGISVNSYKDLLPHTGRDLSTLNYWTKRRYK